MFSVSAVRGRNIQACHRFNGFDGSRQSSGFFTLANLQDRGTLYIGANTEVYEGMVIGNVSKGNEMAVNPIKGKKLSNVRASGSDEAIQLTPPYTLTIERGLEIMNADEYLEITPASVRLRKKYLTLLERNRGKERFLIS